MKKSSRRTTVESVIASGILVLSCVFAACGGESSAGDGSDGSGGTFGPASGGSLGSGGETSAGGSVGSGGTGSGGATATCPAVVQPAGDTTRTLTLDGKSRSYVLHVPENPQGGSVPLIVDFHPLGGSGPAERSGSPYPAQTDAEGVIMAFPSGESGPSGGAWNVGPCCVAGVDDVAFARAIVADIQSISCVDSKRIYAVGFSMGGGMTHYLGCHAADLFAAIAPAAFDLLEENVDDCSPSRPLTVVAFRGTNDQVVPYEGGYSPVVSGMPITFLGAETTFEKWASFDGCSGAAVDQGSGCKTYQDCQDGVTVTLCTKTGGGHEYGNAAVAWPILKQHTLP